MEKVKPPLRSTSMIPIPSPSEVDYASSVNLQSPPSRHESRIDVDDPKPKKKQKRNKPTLSCHECVERKTKCDRGRPHCLACIKRQSQCKYAHVANVIEETSRNAANGRRMTKPSKSKSIIPPQMTSPGTVTDDAQTRAGSRTSNRSLAGLLSNVPYSHPSASNVFGIGSEHPFANYWTCQGGLQEVISVLPDKMQADILLDRYFECMDPVYPMIHRQTFYAEYSHFMSLAASEKKTAEGTLIALIYAMLAIGTQFMPVPRDLSSVSTTTAKQTAEFYVSAAHQSLRLSSYLNKTSLRSIQAMVLVTYFLINDNHASDGWAFAGILIRQAYAMGLHRDPKIMCPDASLHEMQQRRKLWQAVLLQDTFLTVLLSLPPSATHTDVSVADLVDDTSSIASSLPTDTAYIRGCWTLANLVQETICSPRSLSLPICTTPRQKTHLLSSFRTVYRSLPDIFRSWDVPSLTVLASTNKRAVRQTLFLTSNYWHNVMLIHASEGEEVDICVKGTLEAAHEAISSFFLLWRIFGEEARVWWVFNHRAFLEAMCMGNVIRDVAKREETIEIENAGLENILSRAKADIVNMVEIMQAMAIGNDDSAEVARTRINVLSAYL